MSSIQSPLAPFVRVDVIAANVSIMGRTFERFRQSQLAQANQEGVPTPAQLVAAAVFHGEARAAIGLSDFREIPRIAALAEHGICDVEISPDGHADTLRSLGFREGSNPSWPSIRHTGGIAPLGKLLTWRPSTRHLPRSWGWCMAADRR